MILDAEHIAGLVVATAILGLSPGPAVFATLARAIRLRFRQTAFFIAGIVLADFVFALLAMLGLAILVSQHQFAFMILKCFGGGYLLYLGMMAIAATFRAGGGGGMFQPDIPDERRFPLFLSGFLLTASNPKDLLFFISFLPAFIDLNRAGALDLSLAAFLIAVTFTGTLTFYALIARRASSYLTDYAAAHWLDRVAGALLIGVGLLVLFGS